MSDQRFNTGNPIGSNSPLDRSDNTRNLDVAVNAEQLTWVDRLGRDRKSFEGMEREFDADQAERVAEFSAGQTSREQEFDADQIRREQEFRTFIASSGYQFAGDYAAGIEITQYNQLVRDESGEFWRVSGQVDLPYVTTGSGIPEDDALVPAGDAVLRQDLANPDKGASLVGFTQSGPDASLRTAQEKMRETVSVLDFGAVGDDSTDNTEAFRAAVGSLAGIGGEVVVPTAGVYLVRVTNLGEEAFVLPKGVSLRMAEGAWLAPVDPTIGGTFIGIKGNQRIQVNIDGRGMPDDGTITGVWKPSANMNGLAVRRDESAQVHNVEITGCVIHSLSYPIRPVGAVSWKIHQNTLYNYMQTGVLFSFYEGMSCHGNLIHGNLFRNCGDAAVAFWPQAGLPAGGGSYYNTISSNVAEEHHQRTGGSAYDFESTALSIPGQNYNNSIINNVSSTTYAPEHKVGGIVVHFSKRSIISGNHVHRVHSSLTNDNRGIQASESTDALITNNVVSGVKGRGIDVEGSVGAKILGNTIRNCGSTSYVYSSISVHGVENCDVEGNSIEFSPDFNFTGPSSAAIASRSSDTKNLRIKDNVITNPPSGAIYLRNDGPEFQKNIQVTGNSIVGTGAVGFFDSYPIHLEKAEGGIIENNYIYDAAMGIIITGSSDLVVRGNVFKGERDLLTLLFTSGITNTLVEGNRCTQTTTNPISSFASIVDKSLGNKFINNDVITTENRGLIEVDSSGTPFNHGLIVTPSTVILTPVTSGVRGLRVHAATDSTINARYDEPTGPIEFYWEAKV